MQSIRNGKEIWSFNYEKVHWQIDCLYRSFVITLFVSSSIYNQGNKELTTSMTQASLPLVHITTKGIAYNYLHGLKQEMDGSFFEIQSHRLKLAVH